MSSVGVVRMVHIVIVVMLTLAIIGVYSGINEVALRDRQAAAHERMLDQTVFVSSAAGHGSGVVIGPRTILTVAHVAEMASEFDVEFRDGRVIKARPLWFGLGEFDAAVLVLADPVEITPARLSCAPVTAGQELLAIGNPLEGRWVESLLRVGSQRPMLGQVFKTLVIGFIAPGMSGGPVFNSDYEIVGLSQSIRVLRMGMGGSISGLAQITSSASMCAAGLGRA